MYLGIGKIWMKISLKVGCGVFFHVLLTHFIWWFFDVASFVLRVVETLWNTFYLLFRDYFRRIMLLSSTVWTCSFTGRSGLTFDEAKESERKAKKMLKDFPSDLKAPTLMVTSLTKRSGISDLVEDVFNYVTETLFKGEEINYIKNGKIKDSLVILEIIMPPGKE